MDGQETLERILLRLLVLAVSRNHLVDGWANIERIFPRLLVVAAMRNQLVDGQGALQRILLGEQPGTVLIFQVLSPLRHCAAPAFFPKDDGSSGGSHGQSRTLRHCIVFFYRSMS